LQENSWGILNFGLQVVVGQGVGATNILGKPMKNGGGLGGVFQIPAWDGVFWLGNCAMKRLDVIGIFRMA
jgi:hypothetical protein